MTTSGLERLDCWVKAKDLAIKVYRQIVPILPSDEKYNLSSQIKRAAASIPANIAEGYGRFYYQVNIQFCYNARGSLEELLSHLILAHELRYIKDDLFFEITATGNNLDLLLNGYISYLHRSKQGEKEFDSQKLIQEVSAFYSADDSLLNDP